MQRFTSPTALGVCEQFKTFDLKRMSGRLASSLPPMKQRRGWRSWMPRLTTVVGLRAVSRNLMQLKTAERSLCTPRLDHHLRWWRLSGRGCAMQRFTLERVQAGTLLSHSMKPGHSSRRCVSGSYRERRRGHRRMILAYSGLPWRGELRLDEDHRIGPPSKHPDYLLGPQVFIVDAMIDGIGQKGINARFQTFVHELRVFLGFMLGLDAKPHKMEDAWVPEIDAKGIVTDCTLRPVGYVELSAPPGFPPLGSAPPIERRDVLRPG